MKITEQQLKQLFNKAIDGILYAPSKDLPVSFEFNFNDWIYSNMRTGRFFKCDKCGSYFNNKSDMINDKILCQDCFHQYFDSKNNH